MTPLILNIETSTACCSVALQHGSELLRSITEESAYSHSKRLTVIIEQMLSSTEYTLRDLDAVALSEGPGSYTGLRVGSAVAKGLCFGLGCAFIPINTLDIISNNIEDHEKYSYIIPTIDARRDEAYISIISKDMYIEKDIPHIFSKDSFAHLGGTNKVLLCGNAANKASKIIETPNLEFIDYLPNAEQMVSLSAKAFNMDKTREIASFIPNYIKAPNITKSKKKLL